MLESVPPLSDAQFRMSVVACAIVLGLGIGAVRFCGSVSLPAKPAPPANETGGASKDLLTKSSVAQPVYEDFVRKDAAEAGVPAPTYEEMTKKLAFRSDETRHVLEVGQPPIEVAGLQLAAVIANETLALEMKNTTSENLGYYIKTSPTPNSGECNRARPLPLDVMVIGKGEKQTRVECVYREGMALVVEKVQTVETSPLSAYYLRQVPPALVGVEERVAKGHVAPKSKEPCSPILSQAVRTSFERGQIDWRDLADFYSRHRCQTYSFPLGYRAFTEDGQHPVPATDSGM
jgi:hypothetical protein